MLRFFVCAVLFLPGLVVAELRVVASIVPVHALVSAILQDVATPELLLRGNVSPHDYALRPSDMRSLVNADVVFWIGSELETTLVKPLQNAPDTRSVELLKTPINRLPLRESGIWLQTQEDHNHKHDTSWDPHIWLDPVNARVMLIHIAAVLSELDPANREKYAQNLASYKQQIHNLQTQLAAQLKPVQTQPYIVFHDAYQHFERRFGLQASGSITLHPERQPGARKIQTIRDYIRQNNVKCVFSEPQFRPALIRTLIAGSDSQSAVLDPLGSNLVPGADAYRQLLQQLTDSIVRCLK